MLERLNFELREKKTERDRDRDKEKEREKEREREEKDTSGRNATRLIESRKKHVNTL